MLDKKRVMIILMSVFLLIIITLSISFVIPDKNCGDGTLNGECSDKKPYFCTNGILLEKPSICGCPETFNMENGKCISEYTTNPKKISLGYILRGNQDKIDFTVYGGFADYLSSINKISKEKSRKEFKLKLINNEKQKDLLLPLLVKIQNKTDDKKDQIRIAVSLIQNIPYNSSKKNLRVGYQEISYHRYPYEVLYDEGGICDEKTELLTFLLKEMGYDVALFYYSTENHEAIGIKCPAEYSLNNTGYCFVETVGPSIISDYKQTYSNGLKLSSSFELIPLFNGTLLDKNFYEFEDAEEWENLNEILEEEGELNFFRYYNWKKIREKYGL